MGDRANVVVLQAPANEEGVFLYTHWGGYDLAEAVAAGLEAGRERWDDDQYLARILFDAVKGELSNGEPKTTGFGITTRMHDNERPLIVVDTKDKRVGRLRETDGRRRAFTEATHWLGFEEFLALGARVRRRWHLEGVAEEDPCDED